MSIADKVARFCLLSLFFLLPFFFLPLSWVTIAQSKMLIIALAVLVAGISWITARLLQGEVHIHGRFVLAAAALIPVAYGISALLAGAPAISLVGSGVELDTVAGALILFGALAFCIFALHDRASVRSALNMFFIGMLITTLLETVHFLMPSLLGGAIAAPTGNPVGAWHEFSILLGLGAVLGASLFSAGDVADRRFRLVHAAVLILSIMLLVVANYFDVWVAIFAVSLILLVVRMLIDRRRGGASILGSVRANWAVLGVVIIAAVFGVFGVSIQKVLPQPLQVSAVEVRPSWRGTFEIGTRALTHPTTLIFGAGPNTFTRQWQLYKPPEVNQTAFWNTSFNAGIGAVPTSFVTTGIAGLLAWILLFGAFLYAVFQMYRRRETEFPEAEALIAGAVFLMAFHVLYPPGPMLGVLMFLFIGLTLAACSAAHTTTWHLFEGPWWHIARSVGIILAAVVIIVAALSALRTLASEMLVNRAIVAYNQTGNIADSSRILSVALRVYPGSDRAQRAGVELGLLKFQSLASDKTANADELKAQLQATLDETIKHGLSAVSINSGDYQNWLELAALYGQLAGANVQGAYDNARAAYERAVENNPSNPVPYLNLAQLELLQNRKDTALQYLAKAVTLKQDFAAAYYLASQIYASENDLTNALGAAAQAARYAPDDPQAWYNAGVIAYAGEDYDNATIGLKQALALQPQFANAMYVLGLSYYAKGDLASARATFEALDKLDAGEEPVQKMLENIRKGIPYSAAVQSEAKPKSE